MKRILSSVMAVLLWGGFVISLSGCMGIPEGTSKTANVGKLQLLIEGAGLVKADTEKTTFRIKCGHCGFAPEEITIDTPSVGNPYILNWVCPRNQTKQMIVIEASGL